eukprot:2421248-Rhodomonas_salina.2
MQIALHAKAWFDLIPFLDLTTIAILKGQYRIPKLHHNIPPSNLANLHTLQLDPQFIREIIAKYLVQGVLEHCCPSKRPHNISPLSLVPKDSPTTPWILVTDL